MCVYVCVCVLGGSPQSFLNSTAIIEICIFVNGRFSGHLFFSEILKRFLNEIELSFSEKKFFYKKYYETDMEFSRSLASVFKKKLDVENCDFNDFLLRVLATSFYVCNKTLKEAHILIVFSK